ncbi:glycosyl transferase [Paenibacillus sp. PK3_47]|uniref:glycosyltransferase family 2 protein n=1 Tax=Paenibacillus sp. PK3_47 TaxID=2072642 RepID=UPI00201D82CB|nr:glycosyltransferase family 2 protein [Paenibacillus sp. PK3_47]UQZ36952.1 glycosyl transferase [Paenibacillus sp. PK3_47]
MKESFIEIVYNILNSLSYGLVFYVAFITLVYITLFILAAGKLFREKDIKPIQYDKLLTSELAPPLSILVPAYNEELNIVWSVRSLLGINYKQFEIIVINDGSKDATAKSLIEEFQMVEIKSRVQWSGLGRETKPIRGIYRSLQHHNLVLVDKENGGKADALNVGINVSQYPYFASLDGDTVLDTDAFIKVMKPVTDALPGEEIVATGGSVGIANGSYVDSGHLSSDNVFLSRKPLVIMQVIEYLRAFLMGRVGLSRYNLLLIVSGAFGVFKKDWVIEAGGYEPGTIGEDMELIVRLHRRIREKKSKARIIYVPDPVCWTEAPETLKVLHRQRTRWHRGLFESLWKHKVMLLNPRYGRIGMVAMPYFLFVELLSPVIELLAIISLVLGISLGMVNLELSMALLLVMVIYGSLLSAGAVLFEQWYVGRYNKIADLFRLFFYALSEAFWFRPLMLAWRSKGLYQAIRGKQHQWGDMVRSNVMNSKKPGA